MYILNISIVNVFLLPLQRQKPQASVMGQTYIPQDTSVGTICQGCPTLEEEQRGKQSRSRTDVRWWNGGRPRGLESPSWSRAVRTRCSQLMATCEKCVFCHRLSSLYFGRGGTIEWQIIIKQLFYSLISSNYVQLQQWKIWHIQVLVSLGTLGTCWHWSLALLWYFCFKQLPSF